MGPPPMTPPLLSPFSSAPNPLMTLLSDPDFQKLIQDKLQPKPDAPVKRKPWQEPAKPAVKDMLHAVQKDRVWLDRLVRRFQFDMHWIDGQARGVFKGFDKDVESTWFDSEIVAEERLIQSKLGSIPPVFESPKRRLADAEEAQAKEDFVAHCHDIHRRQHYRNGWADLDIEMIKTATRYGRLVTQNICNFDDDCEDEPFLTRMIDPAIFWPTYSGNRGMIRATLVYRTSIGDFLGNYDDDGSITKKLKAGTGTFPYEMDDDVEISEYWDCMWMALFVNGMCVRGPLAHNYGEPPFVLTPAPFGPPMYTRDPGGGTVKGDWAVDAWREYDYVQRGASYFHDRFPVHEQKEALLSKIFTRYSFYMNETLWVSEVEEASESKPFPEITRGQGGVNIIPANFKLQGSPEPPLPATLGPLLQNIGEDAGRMGQSPQDFGVTSPQQTGYAIAGMSEHSDQKIAPIRLTKQAHLGRVAEQQLRFFHDNGHLMGNQGSKGTLHVPKANPAPGDTDGVWELTPAMIDRTGWEIECRLVEVPGVTDLSAMANAFGLLGQQGVIGRADKIRLLGLPNSRNPQRAMDEIDEEQAKEDPRYKMAKLLRAAVVDDDDPDFARLIVMLMQMDAAKQGGGPPGMPPPPPPPPPGGGPGGPPPGMMKPPGGASLPGMSLPGMGQPPGQMGGRPPGLPPGMPPPGTE